MDTNRIPAQGDPFTSAPDEDRSRPCACYASVVFIGHLVEDPGSGEEVEVFEAYACRRCASAQAGKGLL